MAKKVKEAQPDVHALVQLVLEKFQGGSDAQLATAFGILEEDEKPRQALSVALNAVQENGEITDLNRALAAAGVHFSLINGLMRRGVIERRNKQANWTLTKQAVKNLESLVGEQGSSTATGLESTTSSTPTSLEKATLADLSAFVQQRITSIEMDMDETQRLAAEKIAEVQREADDKIERLRRERNEFTGWIKQLAGEIN